MKNPFFNDDDSPNPSEERIIKKVIFLKLEDSECRVIGWQYEVQVHGVILRSNRTFDSLQKAVEEFLESRTKEP
jgi:hypothetical protein